jgi:hypothetical protein
MQKHLTQSTYETMACPHQYGLVHIEGQKPPDTLASVRGRDIHEMMAAYSEHCAARRVPSDLSYFEGMLLDTGDDAAEIMQNAGDSIRVDWQNFYAAEVSMGLDEDFKPTYSIDHDGNPVPFREDLWRVAGARQLTTGKPPMACGILDDIAIFAGNTAARIRDYKSHPRPFEPTTFQAKLYSLMLFMHMPELQEVEFVLVFVRYTNIARPIKFHRDQVPELKDEVLRVRNRQIQYHHDYQTGVIDYEEGLRTLPALAGTHCTYCPALSNPVKCPISSLNPMLELSPEERMHYRLWYAAMNRANNQAMKQWVEGTGNPIHATDANGKRYTFGPVETEDTMYPVFTLDEQGLQWPIIEAIADWVLDPANNDLNPTRKGSMPWFMNLRIGATELNRYLTAKKREPVHSKVRDLGVVENNVQFKVSRDAEVDDGQGEEYRKFDHRDPQGENAGAEWQS